MPYKVHSKLSKILARKASFHYFCPTVWSNWKLGVTDTGPTYCFFIESSSSFPSITYLHGHTTSYTKYSEHCQLLIQTTTRNSK